MEDFLNNFSYDKYLKKPNWKYTFSPFKDEEKIKYDLMSKNTIMKFYNKMKKPTTIKKEFKKKPRMVQIIEDNISYKNRLYDNPLKDDNYFAKKKNQSIKFGENKSQIIEDINYEDKNNDLNGNFLDMNHNKNRIHFGNIYKGDIYPYMKGKILLSPIKIIKIKEGESNNYSRNYNLNRQYIDESGNEGMEEE